MKIVLSGYYGFDNMGDEAILYSIIHSLRSIQPEIDITVLSHRPHVTRERYNIHAVNRWNPRAIIEEIKSADGVISGGGSLLQDVTSNKSIPYYTGVMFLAHFFKKPFFIYAQGMGPIQHFHNRLLTRVSLEKAKWITVRDKDSKKLLEQIGIKNDIDIIPDPVLGMNVTKGKSKWFQEQGFKKPVIAISVREWPSKEPFKQKIALALDKVAKSGKDILFVPMHSHQDDKISREVMAYMTEKAYVAPHDASIDEKITLIGEATMLVGMRLHALIFAAITNTPFIGISYDQKIDAFLKLTDQPLLGHVDEPWTPEDLYQLIDHHYMMLSREKDALREKVSSLQKKAHDAAKCMIELLNAT